MRRVVSMGSAAADESGGGDGGFRWSAGRSAMWVSNSRRWQHQQQQQQQQQHANTGRPNGGRPNYHYQQRQQQQQRRQHSDAAVAPLAIDYDCGYGGRHVGSGSDGGATDASRNDYDTLAADIDWAAFAMLNAAHTDTPLALPLPLAHSKQHCGVAEQADSETLFYHYNPTEAIYSTKVFIGGLPVETSAEDLRQAFRPFGELSIDWPRRSASAHFDSPPKGYAFLIFANESCVRQLMSQCARRDDKHLMRLLVRQGQQWRASAGASAGGKTVQVRAWRLANAQYLSSVGGACDLRKAVFVGGLPRTMKAVELAAHMHNMYGPVVYAGIDVDAEHGYPKGAARCVFATHQAFVAAAVRRYVTIWHGDHAKKVEIKPYILDEQPCDQCGGGGGGGDNNKGGSGTRYCASVACLQYYCAACWATMHSASGRRWGHEPVQRAPTAFDEGTGGGECAEAAGGGKRCCGAQHDASAAHVYHLLAAAVDAAGDTCPSNRAQRP